MTVALKKRTDTGERTPLQVSYMHKTPAANRGSLARAFFPSRVWFACAHPSDGSTSPACGFNSIHLMSIGVTAPSSEATSVLVRRQTIGAADGVRASSGWCSAPATAADVQRAASIGCLENSQTDTSFAKPTPPPGFAETQHRARIQTRCVQTDALLSASCVQFV